MIEKIKQHKFIISVVIISAIYLILTSVQNFYFIYGAGCDDLYTLDSAFHLLNKSWLGPYHAVTLTKGIGAPIFIAFANIIGVSLLKAQYIFYLSACLFFTYTMKKLIKKDWILLSLFAIILFNPVMYSLQLLRLYRDSINSSLFIYMISFAFQVFFNYKENLKKLAFYMFGLGIFTTWMAICREEAIWILPFIASSVIITVLFIIFDKSVNDKLKRLLLYSIPLGIYVIVVLSISTLNYIYYGEFIRNEFSSSAWKSFNKAVSSVKSEKDYLTVPVTKEAREKIYKVSPTFSKLKDYFEGDIGKSWAEHGGVDGEIEEGWFMWATVIGLENIGYSDSAKTTNDFLRQATQEINDAFNDSRLEKKEHKLSIFDKEYIGDFTNNIKEAFIFQITSKGTNEIMITPDDTYTSFPTEDVDKFREITGNISTNSQTYNYFVDRCKVRLLEKINAIYTKTTPIFFSIGIIIYILLLLRFFIFKPRFTNYKQLIVLTSILLLYFLRIIVIAYTHTALFGAINTMYLSATYSIQYIFGILAIIFFVQYIYHIKKIKEE